MLDHLYSVTIPVLEQERALAFYRDVLGFAVRADTEWDAGRRWLAVAPPSGQTQIVLHQVAPETVDHPWMQVGADTGLIFYVDDLAATCAALTARGVECSIEPRPASWGGFAGHFADPDGNVFGLVEREQMP